ncbi:GNAT family N-acetyltransferase [Lysinibacillus sp. G01H]|uniref:GNAT family N-acetyltransferase n=1 Tax=Lysinibacillus sp. G01H TaxID=3026425 RepID=UPI00237ED735|nr:GNAT family N-acetyltransferase [Lysinibacillus sp. G01H]WDU79740.1 GNAT family N-acetyltransferase [Lysinibacillus sp. G01H]
MKVELKSITKDDEPFLYEVYASSRRKEIDSWGWSAEQIQRFLEMQWCAQQTSYRQQFPHASHCIITSDEQYVGRLLTEDLPERLHIIDISILPSFQGNGVGSYLISNLRQKAKEENKPVILQVLHTNPARNLYERLGFHVVSTDELYLKMRWQ